MFSSRATALEKEKKELEGVLQRRVLEFESERATLQNRIQNMNEDLREKVEAEEKVNQLQVNRRSQYIDLRVLVGFQILDISSYSDKAAYWRTLSAVMYRIATYYLQRSYWAHLRAHFSPQYYFGTAESRVCSVSAQRVQDL